MPPLACIRQVAACIALASFAALTLAADPPAPSTSGPPLPQPVQLPANASTRIAHSAQLTVAGTAGADTLVLQIRRAADQSAVISDDVTVKVDGKTEKVSREEPAGGYGLPLDSLRGDGARDVEIIVGHDGIREVLSGKVSLAQASATDGMLRDHKQMAWWILNIVIVLIAAIAISKRKS